MYKKADMKYVIELRSGMSLDKNKSYKITSGKVNNVVFPDNENYTLYIFSGATLDLASSASPLTKNSQIVVFHGGLIIGSKAVLKIDGNSQLVNMGKVDINRIETLPSPHSSIYNHTNSEITVNSMHLNGGELHNHCLVKVGTFSFDGSASGLYLNRGSSVISGNFIYGYDTKISMAEHSLFETDALNPAQTGPVSLVVEDADAKLDGEAGEKLKEILSEYNLHCMGIAENGFRQLTNSKQEVTSVDDMKNLKIRVAGSNLLMECYKRWGADATNMNWSETYTALQQKTVEGQENPLPAIDAASVQEVQPYCSMWNAIYDCLFFCINGDIYNSLTPEQQKVVDEAGQKAVDYERAINRAGDDEIMDRWQNENGVKITKYEDMDIDSLKQAVDGVDEWYQSELESQGYEDAKDLIETFTKEDTSSASKYDVEDRSDLDWPEQTWNFTCSTTETSTWAEGGRKFGELMEKATGGKIKVNVYAADQLTNGNQSEGIQALMNGDPVQISMHSNLIYSAFDPRFNVVSLPFLFDSVEDADAKLDGEAGEKLKEILAEYGLHCMGIAENGFRQLTNSKQEVKSVDDIKNLKIRVAGSNLLMECYKRWGADATNMNWSETYTALQQKTVEGQENPLPAIDAASVQEVQPYCSMWNAIYDCLFFCINGDIYDSMTPEQQEVIDECGRLATEYEREINRAGDDEIMDRWQNENGVTITNYDDMDIDSFKEAVDGVDEWYQNELESQGYEGAKDLIDTFTK